jgi:neutral ceramidase
MLQVGFGVADITPEIGGNIPGGFLPLKSTGVRDRLLAVACVVHDGTTAVALVGIDALFVPREVTDVARRAIQKATKIPGDNVLVGASHTHSGGPIVPVFAGADADPSYHVQVSAGVASAVGTAWNTLHASEIGIGTGHESGISFNRRFLMRDGREITHPGKPGTPHHGDIVAPAGPIDPAVGILAVRSPGANGKVVGVVVHFACHNTVVGGTLYSPDYVAAIRKHLKAHYGDGLPVCFLLGPCGDITQVDNLSTSRDFGPEHADMMGAKLAAESVRTINRLTWLKEAVTGVSLATVPLPIRSEPDAERERPPFGLGSDSSTKVAEIYAVERKRVAEERLKTPIIPAEVQGIRIGPLGIATNGSEYFCEFGLRVKKASRHDTTWVVSLANDYIGYVPTPQAFAAGGYEPRTARSSKLAPEAGQLLLEGALRVLGKIGNQQVN